MKYLAFRRVEATMEVDGYDCYHETHGKVGIPTDFIVELNKEEHAELSQEFLFLPIVSQQEIAEAIAKAKQEAIEKARQKAEKAAKARENAAKRQAAKSKKMEKEEKAHLKKLQEKYGKV